MFLLYYRNDFCHRNNDLWHSPLFKSDPPPKSPSSGVGLWSLRSRVEERTLSVLFFQALACIFGGVARSAPPPPPPKINFSISLKFPFA